MNRCITFSSFLYGLSMATDSRNAPRCDAMIVHLPHPSYTSPLFQSTFLKRGSR